MELERRKTDGLGFEGKNKNQGGCVDLTWTQLVAVLWPEHLALFSGLGSEWLTWCSLSFQS